MTVPTLLDPLALPLHGSRLIEASAGTGKTFTIAALYLRLVLGHGGTDAFGRELLPPDILVVTFTDAATKELRDRIRQRLTEAARHFRGNLEKPDSYLIRLRDDYPEADWARCARRLEIAAEWMDEAAVSTIHAWCHRMLREHAFDSGSLFAQTLEADHSELRLEVVRDYWRCHCYPLAGAGLEWVLDRWETPRRLARKLILDPAVPVPSRADRPLAEVFEAIHNQRLEILSQLKAPWREWADQLQALLDDAVASKVVHGQKLQARHYHPWLSQLRAWADDPGLDHLDIKTGWTRLTPEGIAEAWKVGEPPEHPAFLAIPRLRETLATLPRPDRDMLGHAAAWIRHRFEKEKARRAELGFDDLLVRLDAALRGRQGDQLAESIRRQFPVALIDEFQDTDPIQYGIFSRIYALETNAPDTGLFMIGDPKQAIYAFRNADIYTYLKARRATEGRHYTLGTNFRSSQAMVTAVNRIFLQAEERSDSAGAFLFRQGAENPLPFVAVEAQGRRERFIVQGSEEAALTLWHPEGQSEPFGKDEYRQRMADSCASEIVRLLNLGQAGEAGFQGSEGLHPLRPGDVAVLVRSFAQARAVREALALREVRSVYLSDKDSVLRTNEAQDMRLWLRAAAEPDNDRLLRAALGSGTLALPLLELEHLNQDETAWEARVLQFRTYRHIWRQQGVLPMLHRLIHDFGLPGRLAQTTVGERVLTNLLHLSELLQQGASELDGEQALIRFLSEQISEESAAEERILRLESDANLVKVITIHKSKGLEYPLVFIPFACHYRPVRSDDGAVKFHGADGNRVMVLAPDDDEVRQADTERLAEDMRLLYVALTRARHACWVGVADVKTGMPKVSDLHQTAFGQLLTGGAPLADTAHLEEALRTLKGECPPIAVTPLPPANAACFRTEADQVPMLSARTVTRRAASDPWWIASYSALRIVAAESSAVPPDDSGEEPAIGEQFQLELLVPETPLAQKLLEADAPSPQENLRPSQPGAQIHQFPRGASPGTFLHGLLEWAAREGFARLAADPARLGEVLARRCQRRDWASWAEPLASWLLHLLEVPLPLGDTRLALQQVEAYQPEMEFWFEARGVDTLRLDALVSAHILPSRPRPRLDRIQLHGMLKGYIDLSFEHAGRYYVADYKSNWLGPTDADYTADAMATAILEKRYDLQYALYLLALHRQLQARLPDYDYDRHMGGAVYVFLRGSRADSRGIHFDRPPRALIEAMDILFRGEVTP